MASKRRTQLYTLSIIIGIGFLFGAGLAAWRRADLVATLSEQISHGEKSQASAAVRQLAVIPNPPLEVLVEAAACDDRATVEAAQVAINQLLEEWQQQVDNQQRLTRVADKVSQLSAVLAQQRRVFPTSSYSWLASVTHKIVRIADKCPPKSTPMLTLHCDEIMTQVGSSSYATNTFTAPEQTASAPQPTGSPISSAPNNPNTDRSQLEQTFASFPSSALNVGASSLNPTQSGNCADEDGRLHSSENPLRHEPLALHTGNAADLQNDDDKAATSGEANDSTEGTARDNSALPISEEPRSASAATPTPHTLASASGTYSTRELLERWRTTGGEEHRDVESQLASRGFKHLSPALVQQYLSTDEGRSHIVDRVLKLPGREVRPWLFLLADDDDADVRLLAVTVMVTSDDRALIEKAWQISIRDQDPRIADLSAHLRERRAGTQLR